MQQQIIENRNNRRLIFLLLELGVYTTLFILNFYYPFAIYYYNSDWMIPTYETGWEFHFVGIYFAMFSMMVFALLSNKKWFIITTAGIGLLGIAFCHLLVGLGFTWWGISPFHPDYGQGYFFNEALLSVITLRSFVHLFFIQKYHVDKKISNLLTIISILIPISLFSYYCYQQQQQIKHSKVIGYKISPQTGTNDLNV